MINVSAIVQGWSDYCLTDHSQLSLTESTDPEMPQGDRQTDRQTEHLLTENMEFFSFMEENLSRLTILDCVFREKNLLLSDLVNRVTGKYETKTDDECYFFRINSKR